MKAMVLKKISDLGENPTPLELAKLPDPRPGEHEILIKISTCGVCHTELDEIEGRTPPPRFPVVPGHQVVGRVIETGGQARKFNIGDRVGIGWIYSACGRCRHCRSGDENLCAGAIGYRSLKLTGIQNGQNLGLSGFGASAHLVMKMARHQYPDTDLFVFARSAKERIFAQELGAVWAGDIDEEAPEKLHSVIDTTPAWRPVVKALKNLKAGGRLVINAIRKEDTDKDYLLNLDYPAHLWLEKEIKSVANVTRNDISAFLELAAQAQIKPEVQEFALEEANKALLELKQRKIRGAKVLTVE